MILSTTKICSEKFICNNFTLISSEIDVIVNDFSCEICESQNWLCSSQWCFICTCGMVPLTRLGMSSLVYPKLVSPSGTSRSCMISRRRSPRIGPASSFFLFVMSTPVILHNQISIKKKSELLYFC